MRQRPLPPKRRAQAGDGPRSGEGSAGVAAGSAGYGHRTLDLHCADIWTCPLQELRQADAVVLHIEIPDTQVALLCCKGALLALKRGCRFVTYQPVSSLWRRDDPFFADGAEDGEPGTGGEQRSRTLRLRMGRALSRIGIGERPPFRQLEINKQSVVRTDMPT
jgi:hypothetical protein